MRLIGKKYRYPQPNHKPNTMALGGGAIFGIVLLCIAVAVSVVWWWRWRRSQEEEELSHEERRYMSSPEGQRFLNANIPEFGDWYTNRKRI